MIIDLTVKQYMHNDGSGFTLGYDKSEVDEVIAEKDAEIARLKALAKEPSLSNRVCRKCGKEGTLMYTPAVGDNHTFWDLYNNKGIDYVFSIQCAHCGEVAFVTKQTHEYELRKTQRALWLARALLKSRKETI